MDYILEEMERQRLALERLLAPVGTKRTAERQEETAEVSSVWEPAAGEMFMRRAAAGEGTEDGRLPVRLRTLSAMDERYARSARGREADGGAVRRIRGWSASAEETAAARSVRMPVRTEMSGIRLAAQEVSRTVEREARRYDGGFEMY